MVRGGEGAEEGVGAALGVDWAAGNVYWCDPRRALLELARLDGTSRYVLKDTEPHAVTGKCCLLHVDWAAGNVFWCDPRRALLRNIEPHAVTGHTVFLLRLSSLSMLNNYLQFVSVYV